MLDVVERIANPRLEFGCLLDVLRRLNLTETRGDKAVKRETGVLKFDKP